MKYISIIILLITLSCSGSKVIFNEKFNNNKNKWSTKDTKDFKVSLDSGVYYVNKKIKNFESRGCLWLNKEIKRFNTARDFTISFNLKVLSQEDIVQLFDFMWGNIDLKEATENQQLFYQINIAQNYVQLNSFGIIEKSSRKGWSYGNKVNSISKNYKINEWSLIKIMQRDKILTVYIDNKEVFKSKIDPIPGNMIGIQNCLKCEFLIDDLRIERIKK